MRKVVNLKGIEVLAISSLFLFNGCGDVINKEKVSGFFDGILHGLLFLVSLIGKIFGNTEGLYAVSNIGIVYWIGYVVGVILFLAVLYIVITNLDILDFF